MLRYPCNFLIELLPGLREQIWNKPGPFPLSHSLYQKYFNKVDRFLGCDSLAGNDKTMA